jgi:hypothetical protein
MLALLLLVILKLVVLKTMFLAMMGICVLMMVAIPILDVITLILYVTITMYAHKMAAILRGVVGITMSMNSELVKTVIVVLLMVGQRVKRIATTPTLVQLITAILLLKKYASMNLFVAMITILVPLTTATLLLVVFMMLMLYVKTKMLVICLNVSKILDVSLLISVPCVDIQWIF